MWDISHIFLKMLSKFQSIKFWNILTNPIKLLQCALLHNIMVVFGPTRLILPTDKEWKHKSKYGIAQFWFITVANRISEVGRDCITRAVYVSWWKWDAGSIPFFWRFPEEFQVDMMKRKRHGQRNGSQLTNTRQRRLRINTKLQLQDKINKLRRYGYVILGAIKSVLDVFTVPKADAIDLCTMKQAVG